MHGRGQVWALAAALFAAVFAVRQLNATAIDGVNFLYLLPICLVAIELGVRPGLVAAAIGLALVGVWDQLNSQGLTVVAYLVRVSVFVGVGVLCGFMADRVRKAGAESERYFELSGQLLGIFGFDGRPIRLNRAWVDVLGVSRQQLMGGAMAAAVHPDDMDLVQDALTRTLAGGGDGQVTFATRMLDADGGVRHLIVNNSVDRQEGLVYVAAKDVTDRHDAEQARRVAEERFRVAFEDSATGMAVVALTAEHSGRIVEANQELARLMGVPREQLLGLSGMIDFAHPEDVPRLRREMAELAAGEHEVVRSEMRIIRRDDASVRWVHVTSSLLHGDDGVPLFRLSQLMDIDARKRADERVRHMADHDALSGLLNRRRFVADLEDELDGRSASRGAVLVIDLDRFKQVNDTAGHAGGDEVIAAVGRVLSQRLRSGDVAGQLGGDEFAVLLRRVGMEQALLVAHGLLSAVEIELAGLQHPIAQAVTLSIGVAPIDGSPGLRADDLLARADAAMYAAKQDGGSRVELAVAPLGSGTP